MMIMKLYLLYGLSFALLVSVAHMATLNFENNCPFTIWPGILTAGGGAQLPNTGFELAPQASNSINVPATWIAGRIWARTDCSTTSGKFTCATADCGSGQVACKGAGAAPPATLAEFTLEYEGQDTYDVSLVDGFNLPLSITPQGGSGQKCTTTACKANVNSACPLELAVKGSNGNTIGCKSACVAFNKPQYCCTGQYDKPETCPPTEYSKFFKNQCPQAYSYAYDDQTSTFICTGGHNYLITFCPSSTFTCTSGPNYHITFCA